jgi:hypothetical protein
VWQRAPLLPDDADAGGLPVRDGAPPDDPAPPEDPVPPDDVPDTGRTGEEAEDCAPPLCALDEEEVSAAETEPRKEHPARASSKGTATVVRNREAIMLPR